MKKPTQNESIAMMTTSAGRAGIQPSGACRSRYVDRHPAPDDELESFRVAAVHSPVSQASEYLVKVREVRP